MKQFSIYVNLFFIITLFFSCNKSDDLFLLENAPLLDESMVISNVPNNTKGDQATSKCCSSYDYNISGVHHGGGCYTFTIVVNNKKMYCKIYLYDEFGNVLSVANPKSSSVYTFYSCYHYFEFHIVSEGVTCETFYILPH